MAGVRLRFCLSVLDGSYLPGGESQNARSEWASERRAKSGIAERRARARLGHIYERSKSGASLPMAASLPSLGRVGSSKDGGACVESGLDARFRDGNGLLLHRFVDGHLPVETGCLRPGMLRTRPRGGMLKTWPRGGNAAVARAARCAWGWASHPAIPCPPRLPPHAPGRAGPFCQTHRCSICHCRRASTPPPQCRTRQSHRPCSPAERRGSRREGVGGRIGEGPRSGPDGALSIGRE